MATAVPPCVRSRLSTAVILLYMCFPLATHNVTDIDGTVTEIDFASTSSYRSDVDENTHRTLDDDGGGRPPVSIPDDTDRKWIHSSSESYQSRVPATVSWFTDELYNAATSNTTSVIGDHDLRITTSGAMAPDSTTINVAVTSRRVIAEPIMRDDWKTDVSLEPTTADSSSKDYDWRRVESTPYGEIITWKPPNNDSSTTGQQVTRPQSTTAPSPPQDIGLLTTVNGVTSRTNSTETAGLQLRGTSTPETTDDGNQTYGQLRGEVETSTRVGNVSEPLGPSVVSSESQPTATVAGVQTDEESAKNNAKPTQQRGLLELVLPPHRHNVNRDQPKYDDVNRQMWQEQPYVVLLSALTGMSAALVLIIIVYWCRSCSLRRILITALYCKSARCWNHDSADQQALLIGW